MVPVNIGDLVLGDASDKEGYLTKIVGMVVSDMGFNNDFQRWKVEWPDGEKTIHPTFTVRMMKDDLKRYLNE